MQLILKEVSRHTQSDNWLNSETPIEEVPLLSPCAPTIPSQIYLNLPPKIRIFFGKNVKRKTQNEKCKTKNIKRETKKHKV